MEHSNNISTIDNLAEFIVSTNDNMRNNGMTGKSKGDLMKVVYGENYSNVDSALPLGLLEEMNINNDERWRYVMDYQNNYGGRLTDLINSIAEKNPNVVVYDNEYEEVDNLPILSAMEKYKNSNYMFDFDIKYNTGGSVNDYIDEKVDEFDADETEMRQQYRGYVRDIEYQGFLAIDTSLTPHERLSDYEFDGEEFDRDNLLEVAKMYPQAEYITFHARLMGDSDFGIEDELSPIDDLAMSFDMNKLNQYARGGGVFNHKDNTLNFKNGINYIEAEPITKEDKKKYIDYLNEFFNNNSELFVRYIVSKDNILTKKMLNSLNEVQLKVAYADAKKDEISRNDYLNTFGKPRPTSSRKMTTGGNVNDYFTILTEQLESKYGEYSRFEIKRIKNGIEIETDEEDVFNEIKEDYANDILFIYPTFYQIEIKYSVENYNKLYNSYNDKADFRQIYDDRIGVTTDNLQTFEEIREDFNDGEILYKFPPMYKLKIGNNDYKGDINDNDITYYNVGIDEGEDIGTRTLEFFDTKAEAQAFMDKFSLSNPNAKLFIDVEKRKVIGQQGNVIVNPKKVSSVVEDKIADFMKYVQRNTNFTTTSKSAEFDDLVLSFYSTLRDYIDEVFNDSPTEVESIEEIDFEDEIENFIIYFTSDEEKREELRNLMLDYLDDDNDTNEEISRDNPRNEVTTNNFYRRLQFINEDIKRVFKYAPKELLDFKVEGWEDIGTLLSNIEIASDLTDNASDDWKGSKINTAKGGGLGIDINKYFGIDINKYFNYSPQKVEEMLDYTDYKDEILFTKIAESDNFIYYYVLNELISNKDKKEQKYFAVYKPSGKGGDFEILNGVSFVGGNSFMPLQDEIHYGKLNYQHPLLKQIIQQDFNKMANGGSIELANEKYLNSIPLDKKTRILQNIADHYGISEEQAYAEITDIESEALYEYITDQNLKMHVYQMMK